MVCDVAEQQSNCKNRHSVHLINNIDNARDDGIKSKIGVI
jgi:hypothetical protein